MLDIDHTLFIQIANFLVLLFILNIILFRPIRKMLSHRQAEMSASERTIADLRDRISQLAEELEQSKTAARKDGFKERENSKNEGRDEEAKMVQGTLGSVGEKIKAAKEGIERNMADLRQSLNKEVSLFSQELAEKVLGRII